MVDHKVFVEHNTRAEFSIWHLVDTQEIFVKIEKWAHEWIN